MSEKFPGGVEIHGRVTPEFRHILSDQALAFVAKLQRAFEPRRQELLARRATRQKEFDAGKLPDFLPETQSIRDSEWTICPQPKDLLDRRVELCGWLAANTGDCSNNVLAGRTFRRWVN